VSGPDGVPPPPSKKLDPQSLVLRGRPKPVLRLRKGLTVGLSGLTSALLVALAWVSLKAPAIHVAVREDEGMTPANGNPEALAGVPSDYAHVPRLGPPLPGDLGRAILDRQRENGAMPVGGRSQCRERRRRAGPGSKSAPSARSGRRCFREFSCSKRQPLPRRRRLFPCRRQRPRDPLRPGCRSKPRLPGC